MIAEIRERVRANYPEGRAVSGVALPDLVPLLHARDAAEAKVAAIGAVNPRRPGLLNGAIQLAKRTVSRLLDWHVREQVEFNRASLAAIEAALEALNENNRALAQLAEVRGPWAEWRNRWEQRLASTEHQLLMHHGRGQDRLRPADRPDLGGAPAKDVGRAGDPAERLRERCAPTTSA